MVTDVIELFVDVVNWYRNDRQLQMIQRSVQQVEKNRINFQSSGKSIYRLNIYKVGTREHRYSVMKRGQPRPFLPRSRSTFGQKSPKYKTS